MTWIWAPDAKVANDVRSLIEMSGNHWDPAGRYGREEPLVTDVGIGVDAMGALEAVVAGGYRLVWHESAAGGSAKLWGVPVATADPLG